MAKTIKILAVILAVAHLAFFQLVEAQQSAKVPRIGYLAPRSPAQVEQVLFSQSGAKIRLFTFMSLV